MLLLCCSQILDFCYSHGKFCVSCICSHTWNPSWSRSWKYLEKQARKSNCWNIALVPSEDDMIYHPTDLLSVLQSDQSSCSIRIPCQMENIKEQTEFNTATLFSQQPCKKLIRHRIHLNCHASQRDIWWMIKKGKKHLSHYKAVCFSQWQT